MKKYAVLPLILITLAACGAFRQKTEIGDISKPETLILKKGPQQSHIHRLKIQFTGRLDGDAEINLMLNGEPYRTHTLSGSFNIEYASDWYSGSAELRYRPRDVRSGNIRVIYWFVE